MLLFHLSKLVFYVFNLQSDMFAIANNLKRKKLYSVKPMQLQTHQSIASHYTG